MCRFSAFHSYSHISESDNSAICREMYNGSWAQALEEEWTHLVETGLEEVQVDGGGSVVDCFVYQLEGLRQSHRDADRDRYKDRNRDRDLVPLFPPVIVLSKKRERPH